MNRPIIGIAMGDPAGIGPEIIVKALEHWDSSDCADCIVIGNRFVLEQALRFTHSTLSIHVIGKVSEALFHPGTLELMDLANVDPERFLMGQVSAMCGQASELLQNMHRTLKHNHLLRRFLPCACKIPFPVALLRH